MYDEQLTTVEETSRGHIAGWWNAIGREPDYPCDTATTVKLLRAVDYDVDPDLLLGYLTDDIIPPVPVERGRHQWSATAIVTVACAAEARRRWIAFSQIHSSKTNQAEMLVQLCERQSSDPFTDLARYDIPALLAITAQVSHCKPAVEYMVEALRTKLKLEGVL